MMKFLKDSINSIPKEFVRERTILRNTKRKGRSQKCFNDKNRQFVPTLETVDRYSSKFNNLKLKTRVLKIRATEYKSTQYKNRLKFLLCLN